MTLLLLILLLVLISLDIITSIHIPYSCNHHNICNNIDVIASSSPSSSSSSIIYKTKTKIKIKSSFIASAVSGSLSTSFVHSLFVPLDVIKTKMQLNSSLKGKNIIQALLHIFNTEGPRALLQGFLATATGYGVQGACKFGFYEFFKEKLSAAKDKYSLEISSTNKLLTLLASSTLAEVIASWALCPLETTRIYMICNPEIAKIGLLSCMKQIVLKDGIGGLYQGIWMILLKQLPYTCCKLAGYDIIHHKLLKLKERIILKQHDNSDEIKIKDDSIAQMSSGAMAGVLAAIISQPADVLLSKVCGRSNSNLECLIINGPFELINAMRFIGIKGLYAGLQPRALMVGLMSSVQFLTYERMKMLFTHLKNDDNYFRYSSEK